MKRMFMWVFILVISPLLFNAMYYIIFGCYLFPTWVSWISGIASYVIIPFFALESKSIAEKPFSCR